jgi:hypothetical protein
MTNAASESTPDFILTHHNSLFTLKAVSTVGERWMDEYLPVNNPETQFWGGAIVIEPRYISDILFGIQSDGLSIGGEQYF